MKKLVILGLFLLSINGVVKADEKNLAQGLDVGEMITKMKLDKGQLARMIDQLVQTGQIKPEEAKKAKEELLKMNDSDLNKLKLDAVQLYKEKGSDSSKFLDPKMKKTLDDLKSGAGESELTKKLRELDESGF